MSAFVRVLKVIAVLAGVVIAGIVLGWLGTRGGRTPDPMPSPALAGAPAQNSNTAFLTRRTANASSPNSLKLSQPAASSTSTNLITDWEDKLDDILTADIEDGQKTKQMLQIFPGLPEEGQVEVAQHLSNLVPDEDYASLSSFLTNSALPESVLDVLLADALNRPNSKKLPALLDVARDPQNPKAPEAKELLELFLEEDYGTDWSKWQTKLDQWLKDNPD